MNSKVKSYIFHRFCRCVCHDGATSANGYRHDVPKVVGLLHAVVYIGICTLLYANRSCFRLLERISETLDLLLSVEDIVIGENITEENEEFEKAPYKVRGCALTIVERLDEEFTKLLKECDPHSNEYVQR